MRSIPAMRKTPPDGGGDRRFSGVAVSTPTDRQIPGTKQTARSRSHRELLKKCASQVRTNKELLHVRETPIRGGARVDAEAELASYDDREHQTIAERRWNMPAEDVSLEVHQQLFSELDSHDVAGLSPELRRMYNDAAVRQHLTKLKSQGLKPPLKIEQHLAPDVHQQILKDFPEVNVVNNYITDRGAHCHARALHKLSRYIMYNCMLSTVPIKSSAYHAHVKEYGGNPVAIILEGKTQVHVCAPVLDIADVGRRASYDLMLETQLHGPLADEFKASERSRDGIKICHTRSENCRITAPFAVACFSISNITPQNMAKAMFKGKTKKLVGCFVFHPDILKKDHGIVPGQGSYFRKEKDERGVMQIIFSFENDGQPSYVHDYDNYIAYLRIFIVEYSGVKYYYSLKDNRCGVQFFEVLEIRTDVIPKAIVERTITFHEDEPSIIIYTWLYRTIIPNMWPTEQKHMQPMRLCVPKRMYDLLHAFALNIEDGKMIIKNIMRACNSFNCRNVNNVTDLHASTKMPIEDCAALSIVVFISVFITNYEMTKTVSIMRKDEERVRGLLQPGVVNLMKRIFTHGSQRIPPVEDFDRITKDIDEYQEKCGVYDGMFRKADNGDSFEDGLLMSLLKFMRKPLSVRRKYPIFVRRPVIFLTIQEEIEAMHRVNPVMKTPEVTTDEKMLAIYSTLMQKAVPAVSESKESMAKTHECVEDLVEVDVPGDGDCALHCFKRAGMTDMNPPELRKYLYEHPKRPQYDFIDIPEDETPAFQLSKDPDVDGPAAWIGLPVLRLAADVFGVTICLHEDADQQVLYGDSEDVVHIKYSGNHYSLLVSEEDAPSDSALVCEYIREYEVYRPLEAKYLELAEEVGRLTAAERRDARDVVDPYARLGTLGYVCRSGGKLNEILTRRKISARVRVTACVDLCAAPGGWTQALLHTFQDAHIYAMSLDDENIQYSELIFGPRFHPAVGATGNGDILIERNQEAFVDYVLENQPEGVEVVVSDGGTEQASRNMEEALGLLRAQWAIAQNVLAKGGDYIQKVYLFTDLQYLKVIHDIGANFEKVYFEKPLTSRPTSTEYFLVCKGLKHQKNFEDLTDVGDFIITVDTGLPLALDVGFIRCFAAFFQTRTRILIEGLQAYLCVARKLRAAREKSKMKISLTSAYAAPQRSLAALKSMLGCHKMLGAGNVLKIPTNLRRLIPREEQIPLVERSVRFADQDSSFDNPNFSEIHTFYGAADPFSNHYLVEFEVDDVKYNSTEQYYMSERAKWLKDERLYTRMMEARSGAEMKAIMRGVRYDRDAWRRIAPDVMEKGLRAKFANPELRKLLLDSGEMELVEANPNDTFWGSGTAGPAVEGMRAYPGRNIMGKLLMKLREEYRDRNVPLATLAVDEEDDDWASATSGDDQLNSREKFRKAMKEFKSATVKATEKVIAVKDRLQEERKKVVKEIDTRFQEYADTDWRPSELDKQRTKGPTTKFSVMMKRFVGIKKKPVRDSGWSLFGRKKKEKLLRLHATDPADDENDPPPATKLQCFTATGFQPKMQNLKKRPNMSTYKPAGSQLENAQPTNAMEEEGGGERGVVTQERALEQNIGDTNRATENVPEGRPTQISVAHATAVKTAVQEYRDYGREVLRATQAKLMKFANATASRSTVQALRNAECYAKIKGVWHPGRPPFVPRIALVRKVLKEYKDTDKDCVVSRDCEIATEFFESQHLNNVLERIPLDYTLNVVAHQAIAGAGKSTAVVNTVMNTEDWMIVTPPRSNRDSLLQKILRAIDPPDDEVEDVVKMLNSRVRTVGSVMEKPGQTCKNLFVDESMMAHAGQILAVAWLTRCDLMHTYGDHCQIPFIPRNQQFVCQHHRLDSIVKVGDVMATTYRCPLDVTCLIEKFYAAHFNTKISSTSKIRRSLKVVKISSINGIPPNVFKQPMMTYTQAEKDEVVKKYPPTEDAEIALVKNTVHEIQGAQHDHISIVRLSNAAIQVYESEPHILVALTRHKISCTYYTVDDNDALATLMKTRLTEHQLDSMMKDPIRGGWRETALDVFVPVADKHTRNVRFSDRPRDSHDTFVVRARDVRELDAAAITKLMTESVGKSKIHVDLSGVSTSKAFDLSRKIYQVTKERSVKVTYSSNTYLDFTHPNVADLFCRNGILDEPTEKIEATERVEFDLPDTNVVETREKVPVAAMLQTVYDQLFDCETTEFADHDMDQIHLKDYETRIDDVSLNPVKVPYYKSKYDTLQPVVVTHCPDRRPYTQPITRMAVQKRNAAAAKVQTLVDADLLVADMGKKFLTSYVDQTKWREVNVDPIVFSLADVHEWLMTQPTNTDRRLATDDCLENQDLEKYFLSIKRDAKAGLTADAPFKIPQPQTIAYSEKHVNAIFCVIWRKIVDRILLSLKRRVKIFTKTSADEFAQELTRAAPPSSIKHCRKVEVDISRYDKSQELVALEFDCWLMSVTGVDVRYIELWRRSHTMTTLRDMVTGLMMRVLYQRKSGDASTFAGNTLYLMGVMAYFLPMDKAQLAMFAGDDSLIYFPNHLSVDIDSTRFANLFNLELKTVKSKAIYFCSKFLVPMPNDSWRFVPDAVKMLVKLGRRDLVNETHRKCYHVSFVDHVKGFLDQDIKLAYVEHLAIKYGGYHVMTLLIDALSACVDYDVFASLFTRPLNANIDENRLNFKFDD